MHYNEIVIEVTRRCNFHCEHCLRGDSENKDQSESNIDSLFSNLVSISRDETFISYLTLSGGEPGLVPDILQLVLKKVKKYNIQVGTFYIATNGSCASIEFIEALFDLYEYQDNKDTEGMMVKISNDSFHLNEYEYDNKAVERLSLLKFVYLEKNIDYYVIPEGRGKNIPTKRKMIEECYELDNDSFDGPLYLSCDGYLIKGCNYSYKNMKKHRICKVEDFNESILKGLCIKEINVLEQ